MPLAPHALDYDDSPAGSDLRREFGEGGAVTITSPAGEPSAAARRDAIQRMGITSAAMCGLFLLPVLALALPFLNDLNRLDFALRVLAMVLFAVLWGGIFALVWKVRYDARLEALADSRRESAVLHANACRLVIETSGADGQRSHDLPADSILRIGVGDWPRMADARAVGATSIPCLYVRLKDNKTVRLLGGHPRGELGLVAAALSQALGL